MRQRSNRQRWARCLLTAASLVFVLQTLAWSAMPVFAQGSTNNDWIIVCTSQGFKRIALDPDASDQGRGDAPAPLSSDTHCDLCVFAQGLGTANTWPASLAPNVTPAREKARENAFPAVRNIHSCCLPRAPPVI